MTAEQFATRVLERYGTYERSAVAADVRQYLSLRHGPYLDALWEAVRETRPTAWGPPDYASLRQLDQRACDAMDQVRLRGESSQRRLTDGEEWVPLARALPNLAELAAHLHDLEARRPRAVQPKREVPAVTGMEEVSLRDTSGMDYEGMLRDYAARRRDVPKDKWGKKG